MPGGTRRLVQSRSNGQLLLAAAEFVESAITSRGECLLIPPSHSAGEEFARSTPNQRGMAGLHRLTLVQLASDLARFEMARLGLAPLTALGTEAIAARIVHQAEAEHELDYFRPVAAFPGFPRALARTLQDLRLARVDSKKLRRAESGADLARLLARFERELAERRLADLARVFELAETASTAGSHPWLGLPLVVLDHARLSESHRQFLERVMDRSPDVLMTRLDADQLEIDAPAEAAASPMGHLRSFLFSEKSPEQPASSAFEIFSAPGEGLEAVEIARRIQRLSREGVAFDQVAILLRSPERYQPMIEDALRRAGIPAYFSRGSSRPDPGGRAFLALLHCAAEKCSASRFAEYLSLGQVPQLNQHQPGQQAFDWIAPDDELLPHAEIAGAATPEIDESRVVRAPAAWEKLLVDAAVIGGRDRWSRRLRGLEREFELHLKSIERDDAGRREFIERRLDRLRELEEFALPLVDILDALPRQAAWKEWIAKLGDLARAALRKPEPVLAILAEFEPMGDVGPLAIEEVAEVLSERLSFLRVEPPQRRYGRVFVASIDEARGREFAIVFLPGLAEGIFPQRTFEDPLLLDRFRREIGRLLSRDDRADDEKARLSLAAACARDRLVASYPRMEIAEGRPRVPSFYALELLRAAEGKLLDLKKFEEASSAAAPARLNWPAPAHARDAIDDAEYDLVWLKPQTSATFLMQVNPHLARSLRGRYKRWDDTRWSRFDGLVTHNPAALAALETHRLSARPWSPSALQQFAACPYRFALHGIYNLRPREDPAPMQQMDALTRGALFHAAQFAIWKDLADRELLPVKPAKLSWIFQLANTALDRIAAKYFEDLAPAIDRVWRTEIEDLRTDLRGWLQHVAHNDDEWRPAHFEFSFGLAGRAEERDPQSRIENAEIEDGALRLRGSIDLVERHVSRDVYRVTDHKTGKPPDSIPMYVGGGKFLQPLLYGLAAQALLGAPVESGRLFYATQKGEYQFALIQNNDKARAFLRRLLADIDGAIAAGFLPPVPQKESCESCDYRPVCGPYEEFRSSVKKDRRDERLEPLVEIRGML
ncbi:MAG TPA: PD-(D/E)XK nuclease family protein [Bryobacteraceae bacterium]|nr:PD-(D/E)XK nuclease family protein [Bryobacteraceae bacterium]